MNLWPCITLGFVLLLVGIWVYERLPRWRTARARARRERLTEAQPGERFFTPELSPIATRLRRLASEQLGKDLSQLRPEDRLASVLSDPLDSLDTVELLMAIEEEFGIELEDATVTRIETFYDLVSAVATGRPFLAKWRRKLSRAIETQLGVSLPRETLATVDTPQALTDTVAAELKVRAAAPLSCQSQRAFYLLRDAMMRTLRRPRRSITPATALPALIPWRVLRRLAGVFLLGWLLSFLQFGLQSPDRALTSPVMPVVFGVRFLNGDYGMALVGFAVTTFAVVSAIFSISRSKLFWLWCLAIGLYWLWTYILLAIPF